jgi:glucose uptake protein GlcU
MEFLSNEKQVTTRNLVLGTSLILFSNLIYVGNGYIVKWTELKAPEIALVRGVVQMILFGAIVWKNRKESQQDKKCKLKKSTIKC